MSESMDFFYDINARQEIEIERYTGYDEKVVIPERIEGLPVAAILEHAFAGVSEVVEVIVPEGVRSIGEEAFSDCEDLECVAKTMASILILLLVASIMYLCVSNLEKFYLKRKR